MVPSGLMPTAAADLIGKTFFDFVVKHSLADTMTSMSAEQIQVIALFLSHLQRKPPKRVHISDRLDLIQQKPSCTPAEEVASPEVPNFLRLQSETDGAAKHAHSLRPIMHAPVICQLCGAGFLSQKDHWAHAAKEHESWAYARKYTFSKSSSEPLCLYIR